MWVYIYMQVTHEAIRVEGIQTETLETVAANDRQVRIHVHNAYACAYAYAYTYTYACTHAPTHSSTISSMRRMRSSPV